MSRQFSKVIDGEPVHVPPTMERDGTNVYPWLNEDEDTLVLWMGYEKGKGHRWRRFESAGEYGSAGEALRGVANTP